MFNLSVRGRVRGTHICACSRGAAERYHRKNRKTGYRSVIINTNQKGRAADWRSSGPGGTMPRPRAVCVYVSVCVRVMERVRGCGWCRCLHSTSAREAAARSCKGKKKCQYSRKAEKSKAKQNGSPKGSEARQAAAAKGGPGEAQCWGGGHSQRGLGTALCGAVVCEQRCCETAWCCRCASPRTPWWVCLSARVRWRCWYCAWGDTRRCGWRCVLSPPPSLISSLPPAPHCVCVCMCGAWH